MSSPKSTFFLTQSLSLFLYFLLLVVEVEPRSYTIDYANNTFLKDGQPFRYVSGSIHYFRSPAERWDSLLKKMRLGGLNAITTYIPWNIHQPGPKLEFDFAGNKDVFRFLSLAQENDLLVILRPSPFIDAEWDMGGLPSWILWEKRDIKLRSSDLDYNYRVAEWYDELLPRLRPYLYSNGGPVIMMQVENEYGSYGCDKAYLAFIRDLIRHHLGDNLVLFTTDGDGEGYLKCGSVPGVYATLDFGPGSMSQINASFAIQRKYSPQGPLINSEYYPGWLDHWGFPHNKRKSSVVASALDDILFLGANVNIYMYHGGTSFAYGAGSNLDASSPTLEGQTDFHPCPTSYDYDAPLTEAGDPRDKYFALKSVISKYLPVPKNDPPVKEKAAYGKVPLVRYTSLFESEFLTVFAARSVKTLSSAPSFEDMKIGSGFLVYQTQVQRKTYDPVLLQTPELRDRGYVYVDEEFVGILSRTGGMTSLPLRIRMGQTLTILVENQGRVCYGSSIGESKGLGQNATLGRRPLDNWTVYPLGEIDGKKLLKYSFGVKDKTLQGNDRNTLSFIRGRGSGHFFIGNVTLPSNTQDVEETELLDTFVRLDGFGKGLVWINGINLGRYWPLVGPQETLYLPSPFLKPYPNTNTLILFELEQVPDGCLMGEEMSTTTGDGKCFITLTDKHVIDSETPNGLTSFKDGFQREHNDRTDL